MRTAPKANEPKRFFTVTHPFHPWRGQRFELIDLRPRWGQWRVYYIAAEGLVAYLPASWTDAGPRDPFIEQAQGRAIARVEDLLQLKYETLRALELDNCPIAKAARDFGLSRPTIYEAQSHFQQQGLEGLLPHKRGPKAAHKLTGEILGYLREQAGAEPGVGAEELARRVRQRHAVRLHPRTIEKALKTKAKRGLRT